MRIQKFQAADMRDALAKVKRTLGDDAIIVATRTVRRGLMGNGVEVTAAVDGPADEPAAAPAPEAASAPPVAGLSEADVERILLPLRSELRSLRAVLRPGDAMKSELEALRREISALAGGGARPDAGLAEALRSPHLCARSTARVVALVGPTGVGKTTTIAKLAAREALVERRRVAILTLDTYRVGGEDQLRTFADLMGVPLHVAGAHNLAAKLDVLGDCDRVYIDTAGRSPRDVAAIAELCELLSVIDDVEVHLTMAAGATLAAVEKTAQRYRGARPGRILFTKLDEADELSTIPLAAVRTGLPVTWLATGQRVPEDLEDASPARVGELATLGFHADSGASS